MIFPHLTRLGLLSALLAASGSAAESTTFRWRIEAGARIPTREEGRARAIEDITRDVNTAFEAAIRRDPANWFWVHNRWKAWFKAQAQPAPTVVTQASVTADTPG